MHYETIRGARSRIAIGTELCGSIYTLEAHGRRGSCGEVSGVSHDQKTSANPPLGLRHQERGPDVRGGKPYTDRWLAVGTRRPRTLSLPCLGVDGILALLILFWHSSPSVVPVLTLALCGRQEYQRAVPVLSSGYGNHHFSSLTMSSFLLCFLTFTGGTKSFKQGSLVTKMKHRS